MQNEQLELRDERIPNRTGEATLRRKSGNPLDSHVGNRLRLRRTLLGMTQERLATMLGLTFQQVQKYEKGVNRISAGRLFQLANILAVPLDYFYCDIREGESLASPAAATNAESIMAFIASGEGVELCTAFMSLKDTKVRRRFIELLKCLADEELTH